MKTLHSIIGGALLLTGSIVGQCGAGADTPFSVVSVLAHKTAFDRPHDIELCGNLAFVPGKGGSIAIVDVEDPRHPRLVWHRRDAKDLHDAETVLVSDDRLWLGTDAFISIDIRDPRKPILQGRVVDRRFVARINGLVRHGDFVIAANKNGFLNVFDVSHPATPTLAGGMDLKKRYDLMSPHDVDRFRQYAVVVDPRRFGRAKQPGKVGLIEVFDPSLKQLLPPDKWKLKGVVSSQQLTGANRVQVSGDFAFVGASLTNSGGRMIVVDLSDPKSPRQVASLPFAEDDGFGPNGLTVAGNVVFVAGGQSVEARRHAIERSHAEWCGQWARSRLSRRLSVRDRPERSLPGDPESRIPENPATG